MRRMCLYVSTPRQIASAQDRAAKLVERTPDFSAQPGPVETVPAENRDLTGSWRPILPRPEAQGAGFGGLMAASDGQLQYPEEFFEDFEDLDVRPNGFFQPQPAQYPQQPPLAFGGYSPQQSEPLPFLLDEPGFTFGESMARPNGISPYTRFPSMAFDNPTDYGLDVGLMFNKLT